MWHYYSNYKKCMHHKLKSKIMKNLLNVRRGWSWIDCSEANYKMYASQINKKSGNEKLIKCERWMILTWLCIIQVERCIDLLNILSSCEKD